MGRKHKPPPGAAGVQLSLIITPMLDMSFQILAFFIMTYHPSALEGHIPGSLVPPDNFAKKSKDKSEPLPAEAPISISEEDLLPELQEAITIKVKSISKGDDKGKPEQIFLKTSLETDPRLIADIGQVGYEKGLNILSGELKGMKGANKANLKIAADGDLRQQYVMEIYDTGKKAGFDKIHFVPPPVLNSKLNVRP
ncbi:MAG TPA: biopolymer transporter ExbD [Gemmataceae bacterium]|nr:biopolymer transporter ExbD [Gemmataceae bacterium]